MGLIDIKSELKPLLQDLARSDRETAIAHDKILALVQDGSLRAALTEPIAIRILSDISLDDSSPAQLTLLDSSQASLRSRMKEFFTRLFWRSFFTDFDRQDGMNHIGAKTLYRFLIPVATVVGLLVLIHQYKKRQSRESSHARTTAGQESSFEPPIRKLWTLELAVRGTQLPEFSVDCRQQLDSEQLVTLFFASSYRQCVRRRMPLQVEDMAPIDRASEHLVLITIEFESVSWHESILINEWPRYFREERCQGLVNRVGTIASPEELIRAGFVQV